MHWSSLKKYDSNCRKNYKSTTSTARNEGSRHQRATVKRALRIQSSAPPFQPDGWINAAALNNRGKRSREEDGSREDERTREEVDGGGGFVAAGDRRVEDKERLPPI